MDVDSLAGLSAAFEAWRSRKRHPREAVPANLVQRARAAARRHGPAAVARATKLERARLFESRSKEHGENGAVAMSVPTYSRLEVPAPAAPILRPFAEVEMPTGLKVRLFTETSEALKLLSSLLGAEGAR